MKITVLSLFDGISCGQLALRNLNIDCTYFASEVNTHAINVTNHHFPDTIQLGDVCKIDGSKLPSIDLLIGGSPCQGFSFAGRRLNFEDPRSKLFFEFVRILKETNPKYFLLENVLMKKECIDTISSYLQIQPIRINSNLFSAQNRDRLYWTNISVDLNKLPKNLHPSKIKDILEPTPNQRYFLRREGLSEYIQEQKKLGLNTKTSPRGLKFVFQIPKEIFKDSNRARRILSIDSKCQTAIAHRKSSRILLDDEIRRITPLEYERLQTLPDNYTSILKDTYRYETVGNGWTVKVIEFLFSFLK